MRVENQMFCYQCQETAGCKGCTDRWSLRQTAGCRRHAGSIDLCEQMGLSAVTTALRKEGKSISAEINHLVTFNLFTTITNANFDRESIRSRIRLTLDAKKGLLSRLSSTEGLPQAALWDGSGDWEKKARSVGVLSTANEDIRSLRELITYGLKGLSAYSKHANTLLEDDESWMLFCSARWPPHWTTASAWRIWWR